MHAKRQRRQGEDDLERHRQLAPHEDRDAVERHARGAQLEDRDDEVDGATGGRDAEEDQAERVEVDVEPGRELRVGERQVVEPPVVRGLPDEERRVHEEPPARKTQ